MAVDPETIIATAILSEASKGAVKGVLALGREWIRDRFGSGSTAASKANENMGEFVIELANRISQLEQTSMNSTALATRIRTSYESPDVMFTTRSAIQAAARTSEHRKHSILAELVAKRFSSSTESSDAIAANIAAEAIPRLTLADLDTVGLLAVVGAMRPKRVVASSTPGDVWSSEEPHGIGMWWHERVEMFSSATDATPERFMHLSSIGLCTMHIGLKRVLLNELGASQPLNSEHRDGQFVMETNHFLSMTSSGKSLSAAWRRGLQEVFLTPAGASVGRAVYDVHFPDDHGSYSWDPGYRRALEAVAGSVAWDGSAVSREFVDAIDLELASRQALHDGNMGR